MFDIVSQSTCKIYCIIYIYMGVSKNNGTPKSSILIGFYINHPFWGTTIFGNTHIPIDRHFSQLLSYWKPWFPAQAPRHKHHEWLFNLTEERPTSQFFSMVKNGVMVEVRYKGIAFGKQLDIFEICWYRDYIYIYMELSGYLYSHTHCENVDAVAIFFGMTKSWVRKCSLNSFHT